MILDLLQNKYLEVWYFNYFYFIYILEILEYRKLIVILRVCSSNVNTFKWLIVT